MKKLIFGSMAAIAIAIAAMAFTVTSYGNDTVSDSFNDGNDTCTFSKVEKDQVKNKLKCSGHGTLCCNMN
jgi:hypothetical protein